MNVWSGQTWLARAHNRVVTSRMGAYSTEPQLEILPQSL